jgi:sodium-dependent dicarboxylate transporter 2/3/5
VLWQLGRADRLGATGGREVIRASLAAMGPPSRMERLVGAVFLVAATLWILGDPVRHGLAPLVKAATGLAMKSRHLEAAVGVTAGLVLVVLRAVTPGALLRLPWGTLLLLGGGYAMAAGIEGSGLGGYLAGKLAVLGQLSLLPQVGLAALATIVLSAVASNNATVIVMLNVLPRSLTVLSATTIAASCDFALPAGTPPNAIVFGSGYIRLPTMMRTGLLLDLAAALLVTAYAVLYLRHLFP